MKTFSKIFVPALFALFLATSIQADTLRLRNGTVLEGRFVSGDERSIYFQRVPGGMETYPLLYVESLAFGTVVVPSSNRSPIMGEIPIAKSAAFKAPPGAAMMNLREALWRPLLELMRK